MNRNQIHCEKQGSSFYNKTRLSGKYGECLAPKGEGICLLVIFLLSFFILCSISYAGTIPLKEKTVSKEPLNGGFSRICSFPVLAVGD